MILFVALAIALAVAAVLVVFREDVRQDVFCPISIVCLMHSIRTIPFIVYVYFDPTVLHRTVLRQCPNLDTAFAWYGFVEILGFFALIAGIKSSLGRRLQRSLPRLEYRGTRGRFELAAYLALGVGLGSFALYVWSIGGLGNLVFNLHERTRFTEGYGYLRSLFALLTFGVLLLTYLLPRRMTLGRIVFLVAMALAASAVHSSAGGRKNTIILVLGMLMVYHFGARRIQRPMRVIALTAVLLVPFFVGLRIVRAERGGVEHYLTHPVDLAVDIAGNLSLTVTNLSYVGTYVFLTNHFDINNLWLGGTYSCLLHGPIPSVIYPNKPPVNEGVYVRSLAEGLQVSPGTPARLCTHNGGFPPETIGIAYWNFWLPGVVVFMFALGVVYSIAYHYMLASGCSFFSIMVYIFVVFNFQLTSHRIAQFIPFLVSLLAFIAICFPCRLNFAGRRDPLREGDSPLPPAANA